MLGAGLSASHALRTLNSNGTDARLTRATGLVERGVGLSDALLRAQYLNAYDFQILAVSESAGRLAAGFSFLAERRSRWLQLLSSLRAAMWMPIAVLLIGALAGVFIRMFRFGESLWVASLPIGQSVVLTLIGFYIVAWLLRNDSLRWLSWLWPCRFIRERSITYQMAFEQVFLRMFTWQLNAGVPADRAASACRLMLNNQSFQQVMQRVSHELSTGVEIPQSLHNNRLIFSAPMTATMQVGVLAGRWQSAVEHQLSLHKDLLEQRAQVFFKWLPKVAYVVVLVVISRFF